MRISISLITISMALLVTAGLTTACDRGEETDEVVESGTYEGTITEVNPEEKEIYVDSKGQELELYFTEETTLTQNGNPVEFSTLEEEQSVKVTVEKVGKRLDPISVVIQ